MSDKDLQFYLYFNLGGVVGTLSREKKRLGLTTDQVVEVDKLIREAIRKAEKHELMYPSVNDSSLSSEEAP